MMHPLQNRVRSRSHRALAWRAALALAAAGTFAAVSAGVSPASTSAVDDPLPGSNPHKKINRQIDVFSRMLDDVLVESDHALVSRGRNAVGAYVPGQGAVLAFRFSLVGSPQFAGLHMASIDRIADMDDLDLYLGHDGDVLVAPKDKDKEKAEERKDAAKSKQENVEAVSEKLAAKRALGYVRVKEELVGLCAEYGDLLDAIPGNEWVTLVARPSDGPWGEKKITTLILRVRLADARERAEGRIDDATFRKRIVVEEYGG